MSYCFATDIESRKEIDSTFSFNDFHNHMRNYRNSEWNKALDEETIPWIMENAPHTTMITKSVVEIRTVFDDSVIFQNIHTDIDGLTRHEVLDRPPPNAHLYGQQMIDQLNVRKEKHVVRRWCALMSDNDAVHFKLAFPNATALKDDEIDH